MKAALGRIEEVNKELWLLLSVFAICLVLNLVVAFCLLRYFQQAHIGGEVGLALANTFSACFNVSLLTYALRRKLVRLGLNGFRRDLIALLSMAVLAGIVAAVASAVWERRLGHATLVLKLGAVFVPGAFAVGVYWLGALWLKVPSAQEMMGLFMQKLRRA